MEMHYLHKEVVELLRDPGALGFLDQYVLDGVWYWDLEHPENEWMSPGFWRTLSFDPDKREHLTSEWQELIFPADLEAAMLMAEHHCQNPSNPYDQLVRYRTADGGTVTVRCRGRAIFRDGRPVRMLGVHTIVHDTRVQELERLMSQMVEFSDDAVVVWNTKTGIEEWNRGARRLYGYFNDEVQAKDLNDLTRAEFAENWSKIFASLCEGRQWSGEVIRKSADGKNVVTSTRMVGVDVVGKDSVTILQVDRDITRSQERELQLEVKNRELSHRVKNLFAVVQSLVLIKAEEYPDAHKFASELEQLIGSLSRAHEASMYLKDNVPTPLNRLIDAVIKPYCLAGHKISVQNSDLEIPPGAITPIGLIIHELATNAVKYGAWSTQGGTVDLECKADGNTPTNRHTKLIWRETIASQPNTMSNGSGLGKTIMNLSAAQLKGRFEEKMTERGLTVSISMEL